MNKKTLVICLLVAILLFVCGYVVGVAATEDHVERRNLEADAKVLMAQQSVQAAEAAIAEIVEGAQMLAKLADDEVEKYRARMQHCGCGAL